MQYINFFLNLSSKKRLLILILIDSILFFLSLKLSFYFFLNDQLILISLKNYLILFIFFIPFGVVLFLITGQYQALTRFVGSNSIYRLVLRNILLISASLIFCEIVGIQSFGFRFWILVFLLLTFSNTGMRLILRDLIRINIIEGNNKSKKNSSKVRIAIYGAGNAGDQLAEALKLSNKYSLQFFIDDSDLLYKKKIKGVNIFSSKELPKVINKIDQVFLAIPSITRKRKREIFEKFTKYRISILEVPSLEEIASGEKKIESLRNIRIEDLLGREITKPDTNLYGPSIRNKNVFVTGAGGSIGKELCLQIIKLRPASLIAIDNSETNLYLLNQLILKENGNFKNFKIILGDITDGLFLDKIMSKEEIEIVFHAAAYKHVPIVEQNPIAGLKNNIISSHNICKVALKYEIKKVILISSDKAVRPSNVMGASKRLSEMIFQAFADINNSSKEVHPKTKNCFSMVRFGNVLGSSGSVVPFFKEQILKGGPVTVTHPEIIRYFMTISEASQLVIQASELSLGGDLFLLDMGSPVLIKDLAEQMIKLFGFNVKNDQNPNGDIEILYSGLRPGEKLYEELLINAKSEPTINPLIYRANEKTIKSSELLRDLELLENYLRNNDEENSLQLLKELIPEWERK